MPRHCPITLALLLAAGCTTETSFGEADPYWMRSWNEAQQTRPAALNSSSRIAARGEPGTPLIIRGRVFAPDDRTPAQGVVVHSYHRDSHGFDFGPGDTTFTTWRLQGWARTDASGRFEFHTIRPAADHLGREAAHVHFTVESNAHGRQWAPTVYLTGDAHQVEVRIRLKETGDF